jgi:uncharacterized protein YbjT (DUF2867 family)
MKALIIGATGATGKDLINVLLKDSDYTQIVIFVRRRTGIVHAKLVEVITDFGKLEELSSYINGDVWFSCLGTTLKTAGSKDKQYKIDYDIPANFAAIAKRNGIPKAVLLSAYGASSKSRVFYSRIKGKLEEYMEGLNFEQYIIFRPGLLLRKDTDRFGERMSAGLLKFLNAIGLIRKFRPLPTAVLAEKLAAAPKIFGNGKQVIELNKILTVM